MDKIIETFGLTKIYKNGVVGVEELSLEVRGGEVFGFLGANGAGKTTTIRMLVNLLFPTSGKARIFGKDIVKRHLAICGEIGYLPSSVRPHRSMTGEDFLGYMDRLSGSGDLEYRRELLKRFDFKEKDLKRKVKEYSSGMARKIGIIQTFQHRPRLVIMDEPTEGLDPVMQDIFYQLIREYKAGGGTVFISSHHLREVEEICDRAAIIRDGRLVMVDEIVNLKERTARRVQVVFREKIDPERLKCDAWEIINLEDNRLTANLTGEIDRVIKFLSRFHIKDMTLPNASLQDVFLGYYREEEQ